MILGYVLLGALVTRFAVLFTAGGSDLSFTAREADGYTRPTAEQQHTFVLSQESFDFFYWFLFCYYHYTSRPAALLADSTVL